VSVAAHPPAVPAAARAVLAGLIRVVGPFLGLGLVIGLFAYLTRESGAFLDPYNWRTIAVQTVIVGTAALGMTAVMISGGIDLSVGSTVALVTVAIACLASLFSDSLELLALVAPDSTWPDRLRPAVLPLSMFAGLLVGGACGLLNGTLITGLRVVPFIVTLGTLKAFRGLAKYLAGGSSVYTTEIPKPAWFARPLAIDPAPSAGWDRPLDELGRLAPAVWILLALGILVALVLNRTLLGRYLHAVGSSEPTARLCGLDVPGTKRAVYALAGLATGLAGVWQFLYLGGTGDPTTADGLELQVIAAVVIGGGSLAGGEGTVLGTLIGCLIMSVLNNGCVHAGIPNASQDVLIGAIIVAAVAIDRLRRRESS